MFSNWSNNGWSLDFCSDWNSVMSVSSGTRKNVWKPKSSPALTAESSDSQWCRRGIWWRPLLILWIDLFQSPEGKVMETNGLVHQFGTRDKERAPLQPSRAAQENGRVLSTTAPVVRPVCWTSCSRSFHCFGSEFSEISSTSHQPFRSVQTSNLR